MTLERPFRISVLTLVGTGLAALTVALGSPAWFVVGLGSFVACLVAGALRPAWHAPGGVATIGAFVTLQGVVLEAIHTGTVLVPSAHFLILIQLIWLTQERSNRQYGWLCLTSLIQVTLAGVLSVDLAFGLSFAIYLPAGVVTLLLYNLRCELERNGLLTPTSLRERGMGARLLASAGFVALAEMVLTVVIFIYFPRFGLQIFQLRPIQRGPRLTGFSDQVRLGDIGDILDNPEVVMTARLLQGGQPTMAERTALLWRGIALDTYDGETWSTRDYISHSGLYSFPERRVPRFARPGDEVVQEIALEPINTRLLFYLPRLIELRPATPNLDEVLYHPESATFSSVRSNAVSLRYIVRSSLPSWPIERLRRPMRDPPFTSRFTDLPKSISPRVRELAEQIVQGIPPGAVYDRARTIETYLKARYRYSLRRGAAAAATRGVDPVEDFLLNQKVGHCEHFAAAMVVLLRSLGISSRMVTGFNRGEWNEYGRFYIIRQRHAHAWAEVLVPSVFPDWVAFDPTPPMQAADNIDYGWTGTVSRRLAHLRLTWNSYVVNYSITDQRQLAEVVTRALSRLPNLLPGWGDRSLDLDSGYAIGLNAVLALFGMGVVAGGVGWAAAWLVRRARSRRGRGRPRVPAVGFYRRMDEILRRRGFRREPSATPVEFARAVVAAGGESYAPVDVVTRAFCRVRYGAHRLSSAERAEVGRALAALEAARRSAR